MEQQADQNQTQREFKIGHWVFVWLQPYKHLSLKQDGKIKLAPKFYGPYQINRKISHVAYQLELPDKIHIQNVFHASCLKGVLGKQQKAQTILHMLDEKARIILESESIISTPEKRLYS